MFRDLGLPNYEFNLLNTETINADNGQQILIERQPR